MKEIQFYENALFGQLRTSVTECGEPLFCLADVCKALELNGGARNVKSRLSAKGVVSINTPTNGGNQQMTFITEPNLYKCIFQSRKKEAEAFQDWVCSEVLPSIRKTGGYMVARADETPEEIMARALVVAKATIERQQKTIEQQQGAIVASQKREAVLEAFGQLPNPRRHWERPISLEELATLLRQNGYDTGKKRLTSWLRKKGYIRRQFGKYDQPTELALRKHYFEFDKVATIDRSGDVFMEYRVLIPLFGRASLMDEFIEDHGGEASEANFGLFNCKEGGEDNETKYI